MTLLKFGNSSWIWKQYTDEGCMSWRGHAIRNSGEIWTCESSIGYMLMLITIIFLKYQELIQKVTLDRLPDRKQDIPSI